jgi:carboxymethylenebutenolidase
MSEPLTIRTPEGSFECHVSRPQAPGSYPVIVILQEIFGVNAGIRRIADEYARKGYIALCPDLFWRSAPGVQLDESRDRERAIALMGAYDRDRGVQDIGAVIAAACTLDGASGKVGVTGYCMGGLLTYLAAARLAADAFVPYYGGQTERYLDEADNISAPMLYHLGGADEFIDPTAQQAMRAAFVKPNIELHVYPGAMHAFARPGGVHYDAPAAGLANSRTDAFFKRHLQQV